MIYEIIILGRFLDTIGFITYIFVATQVPDSVVVFRVGDCVWCI